jgi:hypothetical protein
MTETIQINWLLLIAPFLWLLGIAVTIALVAIMEFLKNSKRMTRSEFLKKPLFKTGVIVSVGLIAGGLTLGLFKIPSDKLIAVKIGRGAGTPGIVKMADRLSFSPGELQMDSHNKSHRMNNDGMIDNTMVLFWDGYIQTPFIQFKKGHYRVEFRARGSRAKEAFSKIKVEFEVPGEDNYLETQTVKYIQLSNRMAVYAMGFQSKTGTPARIRVTYFNDLYIPETRKGRDVWLKDIEIVRGTTPLRGDTIYGGSVGIRFNRLFPLKPHCVGGLYAEALLEFASTVCSH